MSTPTSGAAAYATVADLLIFHDWQQVADLASDDGTRPTKASLASNEILLRELKAASGLVESACLVAGRYTPADLAILTGNSAEYLKALVSHLAFWDLTQRRNPMANPDEVPGAKVALDTLDRLREGHRIFGLIEVQDAGNPSLATIKAGSLADQNRVIRRADRLFGYRG